MKDSNNLRKYYFAFSQIRLKTFTSFAFSSEIIVIKMFRFGVVTFGPAPCYWAAHLGCYTVIIFYCPFLGHDIFTFWVTSLVCKVASCWAKFGTKKKKWACEWVYYLLGLEPDFDSVIDDSLDDYHYLRCD